MSLILVTGGAGLIGSHLCEYLLNHGHEVLCMDNLSSGSKDNIHCLLDNFDFEFIRHDIIIRFFAEVEQIFHLACPTSPVHLFH